jgi:hypothetical protein
MLHCNEIKDKIMFLNAENTKLIEYLKLKNMYRYADAYFQFLDTGKKLDKFDLKILLKNIRSNDFAEFEKNILDIFSRSKIEVQKKVIRSSLFRVKKHRENIKAKGYKNISLQLPPDIYQKLKSLKLKNNMTYSELIDFLISKEN